MVLTAKASGPPTQSTHFTCLRVLNTTPSQPHLLLCDNMYAVLDSGSNAHLVTDRSVFVPGSVRSCNVAVGGLDNENKGNILKCNECGDVEYIFSSGEVIVLRGVLFVPHSTLSGIASSGHEPTLLVSTSRLVRECNVSLHFVQGGDKVEITRNGVLLHSFVPDEKSGLFIDKIMNNQYKKVSAHALVIEENKQKIENQKNKQKESDNEIVSRNRSQKAKDLARLIHGRIHHGKTQPVLSALKAAFGCDVYFSEPCDACAYAHACHKPVERESVRKANRVGERLHFDVFTSPWRSDTGCKYLLLIVDEFSGYCTGYGMRKRSEVKGLVTQHVLSVEKHMRQRVEFLDQGITDGVVEDLEGVAELRCDNAGENVLNDMRQWCHKRGIVLETTIAHTAHQNGRVERLGGVVWKGGASFRYAAHLPHKYWLYCILAYIHVRNRLPDNSSRKGNRTPYEDFHNVSVDFAKLIKHFLPVGALCYVCKPLEQLKVGKPRRSFKAMFLGYSDGVTHQKGYLVQTIPEGKVVSIAHERMFKCYEDRMVFAPSSPVKRMKGSNVSPTADEQKENVIWERVTSIDVESDLESEDDALSDVSLSDEEKHDYVSDCEIASISSLEGESEEGK